MKNPIQHSSVARTIDARLKQSRLRFARWFSYSLLILLSAFGAHAQANQPPVISGQPITSANYFETYTFPVQATDPDGDDLSYEIGSWPGAVGITISDMGVVSWAPSRDQVGEYWIFVTVSDGTDETLLEYELTIADPNNQLPVVGNQPITETIFGTPYTFDPQATDADGDTLSYVLWTWPETTGISIDSNGVVSWQPTRDQVDEYWIGIIIDDGHLGVNDYMYQLKVIDPNNHVPVVNNQPITEIVYGTAYTFDPQATDADGDILSYGVWTWPETTGISIDNSGVVSWQPTRDQVGTYTIGIKIDDGHLGLTGFEYPLTVIDPSNQTPTFTSTPITQATAGQNYQYTAQATDADGDGIQYALHHGPSGMTVDASTGLVQWTPAQEVPAPGELVKIAADDGHGGITRQDFHLVVMADGGSNNSSPSITSTPVTTVDGNALYEYDVNATDPDNDPLSHTLTTAPAGMTINSTTGLITWQPSLPSQLGMHDVVVRVSDGQGGSADQAYTVEVLSGTVNQAPAVSITSPASGSIFSQSELVVLTGSATDFEEGDLSNLIAWSSSMDGDLGVGSSIAVTLDPGNHVITATVADSQSQEADFSINLIINPDDPDPDPDPDLPADPSTVAPPLDPTQTTAFIDAVAFLYTGSDSIQTGVDSTEMDAKRLVVVRGRVLNRDNTPLSGVTITIKGHPEFGQTLSRADGEFDMAVNGGGVITIDYQKNGYLPVQRQTQTPWRDFVVTGDVVMIPVDSQVTTINLSGSGPIQVAQGSLQTDSDGSRQATVFFPTGTGATMTLPDGSTQSLSTLNVRATEYTVGENGPATMPGELPPSSAYTYAVELSVDEAIASGATRVDFTQPLPLYVDNFLEFPTGEVVPVGWYDREKAAWIPSDNGRVIEIVGVTDGRADIDIDGSGFAADAAALSALGITDAERTQLASTYPVGKTLWRSPITHFTPWDCNWPYGPPEDAEPPADDPEAPDDDRPDDSEDENNCDGCVISPQGQTLGESIPIVGTPYALHYQSDRMPGYKADRILNIPITGESVPASLERVEVVIDVAGQRIRQTFAPLPNQHYEFEWDGYDEYGRPVYGTANASVRISYVYPCIYRSGNNGFGAFSSSVEAIGTRENCQSMTLPRVSKKILSSPFKATVAAAGGWSLNVHHSLNPESEKLLKGNGEVISGKNNFLLKRIAGNGSFGYTVDGSPIKNSPIGYPYQMDVGPDGSLYYVETNTCDCIRKIGRDGIVTTVIDGMDVSTGYIGNIEVGSDGIIYMADSNASIYKIDPLGNIEPVVGGVYVPYEDLGFSGDGGAAIDAAVHTPLGMALGPDGSLYVADAGNRRIRKIDPNGIITTYAGNGGTGSPQDGVLATETSLGRPADVAIDNNGDLLIVDREHHRVRKVTRDGIIRTVAGTGIYGNYSVSDDGELAVAANLSRPFGIEVDSVGGFYIQDVINLRYVNPEGIIQSVVNTNGDSDATDPESGPAIGNIISEIQSFAIDPSGKLYIGSLWFSIYEMTSGLPDASSVQALIPDKFTDDLFVFDLGKHRQTVDSVTGAQKYHFEYTPEGYLSSITDVNGRVTSIARDENGNLLSMSSPDGHRTDFTLDANGYLASATDPEGNTFYFTYSSGGLMMTRTDPRNNTNTFQYNGLGQLILDEDPAGGGWILSRTKSIVDDSYTVTMTSGEGRLRHFEVNPLPTGGREQVNTGPDGTVETKVFGIDGTEITTAPNGTVTTLREGPDPRFGVSTPVPELISIRLPSGLQGDLSTTRTAVLADEYDLLSHTELSETLTLNGKTSVSSYDAATRTWTDTSPEGRLQTRILDANGRLIHSVVAGLAANDYVYNSDGRLASVVQNDGSETRTTELDYHLSGSQQGFLQSITDAENRQVSFSYDAAGRVTQQVLPDSRIINYGYDASGNLRTLTPPGSSTHSFNYTAVDLTSDYTPPGTGDITNPTTSYAYNRDKQLELITRPDGQAVDYIYHATTGKLQQIVIPRGTYAYSYYPVTGQLQTITAPDSGTLTYSYDGRLLLSGTWAGTIAGQVSQTWNNDFLVSQRCVNSAHCVDFDFDDDLLLIQAGDLVINRDPQKGGLITDTQLVNAITFHAYNAFGELSSQGATGAGSTLYGAVYTRDRLGRITRQIETVQGVDTTYDYYYDLAGRLEAVAINGVSSQTYSYDSNSNRTHINGVQTAAYDAQDRLMLYGDNIYSYTDNGELSTITDTATTETTSYSYDVLGNLVQAVLPDGTQIDYLIDGRDRRIGKRVNGALVQGFLYKDQLNPVAELDGSGNIVSRFVYGTQAHVPDYMIRAGVTYRIISDHLGSPRLVVNASSGDVVQRMDYDVWGNVINDTNPGFQPFGLAGGLYDSHTKLTRFGARDYDAAIGRWTSKDPIRFEGGDANLYTYVYNNPLVYVDPTGESGVKNFIRALGVAVGLITGDKAIGPRDPTPNEVVQQEQQKKERKEKGSEGGGDGKDKGNKNSVVPDPFTMGLFSACASGFASCSTCKQLGFSNPNCGPEC